MVAAKLFAGRERIGALERILCAESERPPLGYLYSLVYIEVDDASQRDSISGRASYQEASVLASWCELATLNSEHQSGTASNLLADEATSVAFYGIASIELSEYQSGCVASK